MGYLHLYTGNGKGKTTCATGLAVRAAGARLTVAFIQFDKGFDGTNEHYNERHILRTIPQIHVMPYGLERMMPDGKFRFQNTDEDIHEAQRALQTARQAIHPDNQPKFDLVILDEIITCIGTKLLPQQDVDNLVTTYKQNPHCELVLTGRGAWPSLIQAADLVTEMRLEKHYWYEHKAPARPGIDF